MRKILFFFAWLFCSVFGQAQDFVGYWFDQQTTKFELNNGSTEIDCSSLTTGVHFVHFQITGEDGKVGPVQSKAFLVFSEDLNAQDSYSTVNYWFDQQTKKMAYTNGEIDCSALTTGVHFVHFQITGKDGKVGPVQSKAFLVLSEDLNAQDSYSAINYWFDQQTEKTAYTSGDIDCLALSNGLHAIHFQLIDDKGNPCPVNTKFFLCLDLSASRLCYWFDEDSTRYVMNADDTEINVENLKNGHHTLHAILVDGKGHVVSAEKMTASFTIVCPEDEHEDANSDGICDVCDKTFTGIKGVKAETKDIRYNLSGIRIPKGTKGIVIVNGKKVLVK